MENFNRLRFKLNKIYYYFFKDRFSKKINFDFPANINRWDLIQKTINKKRFSSYLEIGCDDDNSFNKIIIKKKVGVDPVSGGNFRDTSDNFFLKNKEYFDCIFIDGLHEYDQVFKDLSNSIKFLNDNGVIFLHDTLPANIHQQAVPRYKKTWNGDVWKVIVNFRTNDNYDVVTCKIDHGVSILQKKVNNEKLDVKIDDFKKLKYKDFYLNYQKYMRLIDYDKIFEYLEI
tara:strand:+ start:224 stop:910 length:687 start_codon:yes stop_codon:yes gene_type:complete